MALYKYCIIIIIIIIIIWICSRIHIWTVTQPRHSFDAIWFHMKLCDRTTLVARGIIVDDNECLWCYNFQTSVAGWPTHSAEESDAFLVLFYSSLLLVHISPWTMCKRPVPNTVMILHTMIFLILEISVHWFLTCPFATFYSPYLKFLCQIVSFSFHQLRQFLLLERLTSAYTNSQQASTNCPCTDTETALRQLCTILLTRLLPVSIALPHRNSVVSSYLPHLPFLPAVNSLPP